MRQHLSTPSASEGIEGSTLYEWPLASARGTKTLSDPPDGARGAKTLSDPCAGARGTNESGRAHPGDASRTTIRSHCRSEVIILSGGNNGRCNRPTGAGAVAVDDLKRADDSGGLSTARSPDEITSC